MNSSQETYWDKAAADKDFTTPFQMDCFKRHVGKDAKILDVGCGYGRILNELHRQGFENGSGVDFSRHMIDRGRELYPSLDLQVARMPFALDRSSFDAVLLVAVLTCIAEENEQMCLIEEICRVLKPGGVLYINDFLINSDDRNQRRYNAFREKYNTFGVFELEEGAVLRHHTETYISGLLSGFDTLEYQKEVYTTMNRHQSNGFYYLGRLK